LKTLGEMDFPRKREVLEKALSDFSILASGAAFKAYLKAGYEDAESKMKMLNDAETLEQLAVMLSGGEPGMAARANAAELQKKYAV